MPGFWSENALLKLTDVPDSNTTGSGWLLSRINPQSIKCFLPVNIYKTTGGCALGKPLQETK